MSGIDEDVARFLEWCENSSPCATRVVSDRTRILDLSGQMSLAVAEQGQVGVPASFTSSLVSATRPVARSCRGKIEGSLAFSRVRTSVTFAAQAIYQRGRLSVGSYLVLTEPFRVAGFDFEDGWGVGPGAEGVVTHVGTPGVERPAAGEGRR